MVRMVVSLRTKNAVGSGWSTPINRSSGSRLFSVATDTSRALARPNSASPRATSGMITVSPAVGCTSMFKPPFSLATLAIAVPVVWFSEPGCMVARPNVWALAGSDERLRRKSQAPQG